MKKAGELYPLEISDRPQQEISIDMIQRTIFQRITHEFSFTTRDY